MINILKFIIGWITWIIIALMQFAYALTFCKSTSKGDMEEVITSIYEDSMWDIMMLKWIK